METDSTFESRGHAHRERVRAFLTLLADSQAFQSLTVDIDADKKAIEICRVWFEEIYVPSRRTLNELKGDSLDEECRSFLQSFEKDELEALSRFHGFLILRLEMLRKNSGSQARELFLQKIQRDAFNTLQLIDDIG